MRLMLPPTDSEEARFTVLGIKHMAHDIAEYLFALEVERKIPSSLIFHKVEDELESLRINAQILERWAAIQGREQEADEDT